MKVTKIDGWEIWKSFTCKGFPWTAISDDPGTATSPAGGFRRKKYFRTLKEAKAYFAGDTDVKKQSDWK